MDLFLLLLDLLLLLVDSHLHQKHLSLFFNEFLHLVPLNYPVFQSIISGLNKPNLLLLTGVHLENLPLHFFDLIFHSDFFGSWQRLLPNIFFLIFLTGLFSGLGLHFLDFEDILIQSNKKWVVFVCVVFVFVGNVTLRWLGTIIVLHLFFV